jgi:hypothetical protein
VGNRKFARRSRSSGGATAGQEPAASADAGPHEGYNAPCIVSFLKQRRPLAALVQAAAFKAQSALSVLPACREETLSVSPHFLASIASRPLARGRALAGAALFVASAAMAADASVPYVPTPQDVVERMLEMAKVGPQDYLIDLGSGDGRIVVTAARKYGARGFGVDLNPTRISEANENARKAGVTDKVQFYQRDLFETDLSQATVVTMYLLPRVNLELRPKLLDLRPGTRIVSHDFSMAEWKADQHVEMNSKDKYGGTGGLSDVYLWIVPAKVAGTWKARLQIRGKPVDYEFLLDQQFQSVSGSARVAGRAVKLQDAALAGNQLTMRFTADVHGAPMKHELTAQVGDGEMNGIADLSGAKIQAKLDWTAKRTSGPAARVMGSSRRQ